MSTFGERLRAERQRLKLNQDDFSALGGVKKRAQVSYEQDERSPGAEYLSALASKGVDVMFLLTGQYAAGTLSEDESELIAGYRSLDVRGKAGALGMISGMTTPKETGKAVFHGNVNQVVEGDQHIAGSMNFTLGSGKKKK